MSAATIEERRDALLAALEAGDAEGVVRALAGAAESDRRALKPTLAAFVPPWQREGVQLGWDERQPHAAALRAARLGIETLGELKKDWRELLGARDDLHREAQLAVRVLGDRRPPWLEPFVTFLLERPGGWLNWFWPTVRALVIAGLCPRPTHRGYVLGMIAGVTRPHEHRDQEESWEDYRQRMTEGLAADLQADPALLDHELWLLFTTEGTRDDQLHDTWAGALVLLAAEGVVARERLLDASLEALARDFAQFKAGWYSRFHEQLAPTLDERAARVEGYLALCASRIPPTVTFALDALALLDRELPVALAPGAIVEHVPAALSAKAKKTVFAALELLRRATEREPSLALATAQALGEGLAHEAVAVQQRTLDLLEQLAPTPQDQPELWSMVDAALPHLAASLRDRARRWLGDTPGGLDATPTREEILDAPDPEQKEALRARAATLPPGWRATFGVDLALAAIEGADAEARAVPAPVSAVSRSALPCLLGAELALPPTLDDTIELHAALLERIDDPLDLERLLAALVRDAATEPADLAQRLEPLVRRAKTVIKREWGAPFSASASVPCAVAGLVLAWAERVVPRPQRPAKGAPREPGPLRDEGLDSYFVHRLREVAEKLASRDAEPLLATPTHDSGFIAPATLLARGRALTRAPGLYDSVQALLRLAPEGRAETLAAFPRAGSEIGRTFRFALGAPLEGMLETPGLWIAAARARAPRGAAALPPQLALAAAPDAARPATITFRTTRDDRWTRLWVECEPPPPSAKLPAWAPTVALHAGATPTSYGDGTRFPGRGDLGEAVEVKLAAAIWPLCRESYYAEGARAIGGNLDWWEAEWDNRHFLEPLLDPLEPCGPMAALLVALGLCAKEAGERALAIDVALAALEQGRLDGPTLGALYGRLLPSQLVMPGRLAQSCGEIARVSPAHAAHARAMLVGALRGEAVRGINAVLELLRELCIEADVGVRDAEARAFLQTIGGSSQAAVAARALLALETGPRAAATARDAALGTLEGRLRRAEALL